LDPKLRAVAEAAKGFMPSEEGLALYEAGLEAGTLGPLLEIGTYCGKSAVYLGAAAKERGTVLFTIDHHRGSEEMQADWEHHDADLVDPLTGVMNSFPFFQRTIEESGLSDDVVAIVGDSPRLAAHWTTQLGLVFIDGAHSEEPAMADYESWAPKLLPGGLLAIHDVFVEPAEGGQGPFKVYERAKRDGYGDTTSTGSLRVLRAPHG
jgi:predicted O-methyltransferase YrrM